MKDERSGEAVKVVVVAVNQSLTEAEVLAHCKRHLTGYTIHVSYTHMTLPTIYTVDIAVVLAS
mgnify:CR=1 FL=1